MPLDKSALDKAREAWIATGISFDLIACEAAITAYEAAKPRDEGEQGEWAAKMTRWKNMLQTACDGFEAGSLVSNRVETALQEMKDATPPLQMEQGWQPIESAPKDGREILLSSTRDRFYIGVGQWAEADSTMNCIEGWFWAYANRPTHWMPLPQPPTQHSGE
jgi:hypothetical protein